MPVMAGELTCQQLRVLGLVREGRTNRQIALLLHVKPGTVRFHLKTIHAVCGTGGDREALVRLKLA